MKRDRWVRVKAGVLAVGITTAPLVVAAIVHLLVVVVLVLVVHLFLETLHGLVVQLAGGVCILILSVLRLGRSTGRALARAGVGGSLWGWPGAVVAGLG